MSIEPGALRTNHLSDRPRPASTTIAGQSGAPPPRNAALPARGSGVSAARVATVLSVLLCLGPPLAVALSGTGVPALWAMVVPLGIAAVAATRVPGLPLAAARRHPVLALAWIAVLAAGAVQTSRASLYAFDVMRPEYSVVPGNPWRVEHCCFTAYAEGARFASAGVPNVYERGLYVPHPTGPGGSVP